MNERLLIYWNKFCNTMDEESFEIVYDQTKALVWSICVRILHNEDDTSDAFQATYGRLIAVAKGVEVVREITERVIKPNNKILCLDNIEV